MKKDNEKARKFQSYILTQSARTYDPLITIAFSCIGKVDVQFKVGHSVDTRTTRMTKFPGKVGVQAE